MMRKWAGFAAMLSDDIITEILLRLPVKSLLRFKCVCRAWYDLIQSSNFVTSYSNNSSSSRSNSVVLVKCALNSDGLRKWTSVLYYISSDESLSNLAPNFRIPHFDTSFSEVLGPCNGIICITNYTTIVLCNPALRDFRLLPPSSFRCENSVLCCPKGVGFGTDLLSVDDFKVVRIVRLLHKADPLRYHGCRAEIYSLSSNSWRKLDGVLPNIDYCPSFEIFFNGYCHWYAITETKVIILCFNVHHEVFGEIDIPSTYLPFNGQRECLDVLNGSLAFIACSNCIDIWVMKEYGVSDSWIKLFNIGPLGQIRYPLSFWKDGVLLFESDSGQLVSCALDPPYLENYDIYGINTHMRAVVYKETLISIK